MLIRTTVVPLATFGAVAFAAVIALRRRQARLPGAGSRARANLEEGHTEGYREEAGTGRFERGLAQAAGAELSGASLSGESPLGIDTAGINTEGEAFSAIDPWGDSRPCDVAELSVLEDLADDEVIIVEASELDMDDLVFDVSELDRPTQPGTAAAHADLQQSTAPWSRLSTAIDASSDLPSRKPRLS